MARQAVNIVWLNRDLRTQDHAPLKEAECADLPIFDHPLLRKEDLTMN